ncbi:MAG: hydrogenase maturation protease [Isosphaeraceae bacterium]
MEIPSESICENIIVIGYGSSLRSDDSAGPRAAAAVAGWRLPGVLAMEAQQLTPELAEPLSAARFAIFVDARLEDDGEGVRVLPIEPAVLGLELGHASNPCSLLALARAAFGSHPRAWLVTVPATDLAVGEGLSPTAEGGLAAALRTIAVLLRVALEENLRGMNSHHV